MQTDICPGEIQSEERNDRLTGQELYFVLRDVLQIKRRRKLFIAIGANCPATGMAVRIHSVGFFV